MSFYIKIKTFKEIVGDQAWRYLICTFILALLWFTVEGSFVLIIQGYLLSLGLLAKDQTFLPEWYPTSLVSSVLILITMGFLRSCIYMLRNHFGTLTQHSFNCNQRKLLLSYGLRNSQYLSSKETITMFTEVINQSGIVMNYLSMLI